MLAEETVIVASDLLEELRERLTAAYGDRLHAAVLFGSEALGSAGPDSDIDLLAVLEPLTGDYGDALERGLAAVCPVLRGREQLQSPWYACPRPAPGHQANPLPRHPTSSQNAA